MTNPIDFTCNDVNYRAVFNDLYTPNKWDIFEDGKYKIGYGLELPANTTAAALSVKLNELLTIIMPPEKEISSPPSFTY